MLNLWKMRGKIFTGAVDDVEKKLDEFLVCENVEIVAMTQTAMLPAISHHGENIRATVTRKRDRVCITIIYKKKS